MTTTSRKVMTGTILPTVGAGLLSLLVAACSEGHAAQPSDQEMAVPVKITTLTPSPIDEYSEYIATIRSRRSVEIRPQVEGYVARIFVKPGEPVGEGNQLLQIDPKRQQAATSSAVAASGIAGAEVDRNKATLAQLEAARAGRAAALKLAEEDHRRASNLVKTGAIAQQAEDQATATLEGARAELAANERQIAAQRAGIASAEKSLLQTQATVQAQSAELSYYRLAAPFAGTIGDVPVKVGDLVGPTTLLTTLDDPSTPPEAWLSVPAEDAAKLHNGLATKVLDTSNTPLDEGKVTFISPRIDTATQSILVKAELSGEKALRAQQFFRARVIWNTEPGIRIPVASITRLNGQTFAYVVKDGTATQVPIKVGDIQGNDVVVKDGLKSGDTIVSAGLQKIHNGSKVTPATTTATAAAK